MGRICDLYCRSVMASFFWKRDWLGRHALVDSEVLRDVLLKGNVRVGFLGSGEMSEECRSLLVVVVVRSSRNSLRNRFSYNIFLFDDLHARP